MNLQAIRFAACEINSAFAESTEAAKREPGRQSKSKPTPGAVTSQVKVSTGLQRIAETHGEISVIQEAARGQAILQCSELKTVGTLASARALASPADALCAGPEVP